MRQVNQDELVQMIQAGMRSWTPALLRGFHDHRPDAQLRNRIVAATIIAEKLARLEILTSAPEGPPVHYADLEGESGVPGREVITPNRSPFD